MCDHAGVRQGARVPRRHRRGDRDPQALQHGVAGARSVRAVRRRRDRAVGACARVAHLERLSLGVLARRTTVGTNARLVVEAARPTQVMFFPARHAHWLAQTGDGYAAPSMCAAYPSPVWTSQWSCRAGKNITCFGLAASTTSRVLVPTFVRRASTPRYRVSRWANASYGPSMRSTVSHGAISSPSYSAYTSSSGHSMLQSLRIAIASSMPPRNAWALPNTCIVTHGRWSSLSSSSRVRTKYLSE